MVANDLAARSDAVASRLAAGDGCGARAEADALHAAAVEAVNDGRIPGRYQEELMSSVAALVGSIECAPAPVAREQKDRDKDKKHKRGKHEDDEDDSEEED